LTALLSLDRTPIGMTGNVNIGRESRLEFHL
jgi:hypothetical protein